MICMKWIFRHINCARCLWIWALSYHAILGTGTKQTGTGRISGIPQRRRFIWKNRGRTYSYQRKSSPVFGSDDLCQIRWVLCNFHNWKEGKVFRIVFSWFDYGHLFFMDYRFCDWCGLSLPHPFATKIFFKSVNVPTCGHYDLESVSFIKRRAFSISSWLGWELAFSAAASSCLADVLPGSVRRISI